MGSGTGALLNNQRFTLLLSVLVENHSIHHHIVACANVDFRKSGNVPGLVTAQIAADLAHGFRRLLVDFLTGLDAGTANLYAALGQHFQQRFCHRAAAGVPDADEKDLHFGESASDSGL